jgi:hypothetical protein
MKRLPFQEFIEAICRRPAMFTLGGTLKEILAFIDGYRYGSSTPISGSVFERYVCIRNSFPTNYMWTYVISSCATDEKEALRLLEEVIIEYIQLKKKLSAEELMQYAATRRVEESEPAKIFRRFGKALLMGDESRIKPLIKEHKHASILWQGAYPDEVALQLSEIADSQPIRSIPISEGGQKVKIIAAGWPFSIEMNFENGRWEVNAENIIALRMSNQRM